MYTWETGFVNSQPNPSFKATSGRKKCLCPCTDPLGGDSLLKNRDMKDGRWTNGMSGMYTVSTDCSSQISQLLMTNLSPLSHKGS